MNNLRKSKLWIALAVLILPILFRGLWFYQGFLFRPDVTGPDYAANTIPTPPLSTPITERTEAVSQKIVVIDYAHGNQFDPSEIEPFTSALTRRGAHLEYDDASLPLTIRLKYASAYVVLSPSFTHSADDIRAIQQFVASGGRVVVFTDPTRGIVTYDWYTGMPLSEPDVNAANALLGSFGIAFTNDYLYNVLENEGNYRNILLARFGEDDLTAGLEQVVFYGSHSARSEGGTALIIADENTVSSQTDLPAPEGSGLAACILSADGNVLALGDFSFLIPPYNQVADNGQLIARIADFTLGGRRTHGVADFPYLFDRTVYVLPTGGMQLNADLLSPLSRLQSVLGTTRTPLAFDQEPPESSDLLILGTLAPSESLDPYIEPFNLDLENVSSVTIPGIGQVSRTGLGLILYRSEEERNTLILLTDSVTDLPLLIELLASSDLSRCLVQENVAVCAVGYGGEFYSQPTPYFEFDLTPTPTPVPPPN